MARIQGMSFEEAGQYCETISAEVDDQLSQSEVDQIRRTVLRKQKTKHASSGWRTAASSFGSP